MKRSASLLSILSVLALIGTPMLTHANAPRPVIDSVETIHLRPGELPAVTLTRDILYRLLVAELSAHRGDYGQAAELYIALAHETLDPRLAQRGFQAAMVSRDMGLAYQAAKEWAFLAPDDPEAVASSLALAATSGHTEGLASALVERIKTADDKEQAIIQASGIISKMSDKRIALEVLEKALQPEVRDLPIARLALADAAWAALDTYRALKEARTALVLDPNSEPAAQRVLEYGLQVDPEAVIAETEKWLIAHPDARRLQLMLVSRLVDRRDYDGALLHVRRLREQAPEDFDLLYTEAEIQVRAENFERAKALLNEYISVQNQRRQSLDDSVTNAVADASDARLLLVRIAEQEGDFQNAISQLDQIDDPSLRFQAQVHKAVLQARGGNIMQARNTIDSLSPRDDRERSVAVLTLASIYREAGRTDTAVDLLVKADKELPDTPEIKYDLAMLYERQGRMDEFEALMHRVIALSPDDANAYNALGYTYADQKRKLDEAQDLLERALELEPDNPYILDSVGWYFYRVGDMEAAVEYLRRAYEGLPDAEVAAHLGEVLWMSQRQDEARRIWREGLERNAESETLRKTLERFGVRLP